MNKVFSSHAEVCHVWASRSQEEGRGANITFDGDSIYSYGWWEMARFYETKSGKKYVFIRDESCSSSTGKHMGHVRSAIPPGWERIYVRGNPGRSWGGGGSILDHDTNMQALIGVMKNTAEEFKTSRDPQWHFNRNKRAWESIKQYRQIFKLKIPAGAKDHLLIYDDVKYFIESRAKVAAENKAKKEAKKLAIIANFQSEWDEYKLEEKWMRGEDNRTSIYLKEARHSFTFSQVRLRINEERNEVETSMGAYVPVREGKILWDRIKKGKDIKGHKIGYYTVIGINGTLKIGCHDIEREELDRFVKLNNW